MKEENLKIYALRATFVLVVVLTVALVITWHNTTDYQEDVEQEVYYINLEETEIAGIETILPVMEVNYMIDENTLHPPELDAPEQWTSLGEFKITAYCACKVCCGKWSGGLTANGSEPTQGITVAVDPNVISLGSDIKIGNNFYIAQDTGSAVKENVVDVFYESHEDAKEHGVQYMDVFIKE